MDAVKGMKFLGREMKEEVSKSKLDDIKEEETPPKFDAIKEEMLKSEVDVVMEEVLKPKLDVEPVVVKRLNHSFLLESVEGDESGTEEEQATFTKELETFFKERLMEFKPPKFYGVELNLFKLYRAVIRLGGYEQVTSCKLWRQVGESFKPPKTCTTVSWTFRGFYEKALLEYEKHKMPNGELSLLDMLTKPSIAGNQDNEASGSGRTRRDIAAHAMQGWHSHLHGNSEVGDLVVKDNKNLSSGPKREKQLKNIGISMKCKSLSSVEHGVKVARMKITPFKKEVRVQSNPARRLVISGEPVHLDNPWGVTPFKKVVSFPSRIDPKHTSAVVTLYGQLFVRVPF